jgi:ornithine cyclodeaminase/alanine dehydrogenase-like protein (mu-crystallin family)
MDRMSTLYLTEADVERLIDFDAAVDCVEEAFNRLAAGEATNVPRARARAPGIVLHTMSAGAAYLGLVGWKCYTTTAEAARFHVALYDQQSGQLVALIEANRLGQVRTGATTAVAVEYMAPQDMSELGLFGSGWQAESQIEAVAMVRPLRQVFVYSRDAQRRAAFADRMSRRLNIAVTPVDRPQQAAEELPLVITATTSTQPVFDGRWLENGALVCAMGANAMARAEIDATVVRRADVIVCDSVEACRREAGDFAEALEKGILDWSRATDLADVVAGKVAGRKRSEDVGLFKSVGLAIEDVALGAWILSRARDAGMGTVLPI